MKEKFEASKSRNKVLANENKTLKDQVKTLLDKGRHDDELIELLTVLITILITFIKKKIILFLFIF